MHRRSLLIAATTAALTIGALAVPASAANPNVAFLNGIPGKTVDVCVGNQEVKSNLKYGKSAVRTVADGSRTIRFRQARAGTCNGTTLAQRTFDFLEDGDYTVVGTKNSPNKVVVFDNTPVPFSNVCNCWLSFVRHAADVGPVVFQEETTSGVSPTDVPPTFTKGDQNRTQGGSGDDDDSFYLTATPLTSIEPIAGPKHFAIVGGRRGEVILIGSSKKNARFATIYRPLPFFIIIGP